MAASAKRLSADGATPVAQFTWPTILSDITEEIGGPLKFAIENNGTRSLGASPFTDLLLRREQVGTNDGYLYYETALDGNGTISKPWNVATLVEAGAGSWTPGTYGYKVTALNATGETIGSDEVEAIVVNATDEVTISWDTVPTATSYKVYRTATPGTYGATTLVATVTAPDVEYVDDGSAAGAGTPPAANTTGGAAPDYGTAPDAGEFDSTDKSIGELAIGQQWFYWARLKVPPGTTEIGNRRVVRTLPKEIS